MGQIAGRFESGRVAELAEYYRANIARLVGVVGGERGTCRGCGEPIYFVPTKNGKRSPYNLDGLSHFADCPKADRFRGGAKPITPAR